MTRGWLLAVIAAGFTLAGVLFALKDSLALRALLSQIEGTHSLDVIEDGKHGGTYTSEFLRLDGGGVLSISSLRLASADTLGISYDRSLEFAGFPSYRLRSLRLRQGSKETMREAKNFPPWSLFEHLILQRIAHEGPEVLHRKRQGFEVLNIDSDDKGTVQARLKAPVFQAETGEITVAEFELTWDQSGSLTMHRDGGRYSLDGFGRILHAQMTPYHELVPAQNSDVPHGEKGLGDRSMIRVRGPMIEHPEQILTMRIEMDGNESAFDTDEYAPAQTFRENTLTLSADTRESPRHIRDLVSFVHHSLVYDESVNATAIDEIIANGRGDCTEFTDLFDAKAEAAGIEARKILGLAYLETYGGRPPGFYVHAWNQVRVDGHWIDIDATWNQAPASPARIRFPQVASNHLTLLRSVAEADWRLVEVAYTTRQANTQG